MLMISSFQRVCRAFNVRNFIPLSVTLDAVSQGKHNEHKSLCGNLFNHISRCHPSISTRSIQSRLFCSAKANATPVAKVPEKIDHFQVDINDGRLEFADYKTIASQVRGISSSLAAVKFLGTDEGPSIGDVVHIRVSKDLWNCITSIS